MDKVELMTKWYRNEHKPSTRQMQLFDAFINQITNSEEGIPIYRYNLDEFFAKLQAWEVEVGFMDTTSRKSPFTELRQRKSRIMRNHTMLSLKDIGQYIVSACIYDHSTVINSLKKCDDLYDSCKEFRERIHFDDQFFKATA